MSGQATGWVLRYGPRDKAMRAVLVVIADAANRDGEHSRPGLQALMDGSLYGRATVIATVRRLIDEGWLEVEESPRRGRPTMFRIPAISGPESRPQSETLRSKIQTPTNGVEVQQMDPNFPMGSNLDTNGVQSGDFAPYISNGFNNGSYADSTTCPHTPTPTTRLHPYWVANPATYEKLSRFAPGSLLDGDLAGWCDRITDGTGVYWDHQMRQYVAWLESKPPSRRHKNLQRGFKAWVQEAIRRDQQRRAGAQRTR